MSYDIHLEDPITKEVLFSDNEHQIKGGVYAFGGNNELWINITYNYDKIFKRLFGEDGIRIIYGMSGVSSIPIFEDAISKLKDDKTDNYCQATEGNVKSVLYKLKALAEIRPDGIWNGD